MLTGGLYQGGLLGDTLEGREEGKAGLGWAEGEADLQYRINGGFSQSYQRFGAGKASRGSEQAGPDVSCTSHSLPPTFIWEALHTAQGSSHQPRGHERQEVNDTVVN